MEGRVLGEMKERLRIGLVLALAVLVYGNTLLNGFTYDDDAYILRNQVVKSFSVLGMFRPTRHNNVFRPLTFGTFAMNWAIDGVRPFGYHLANLLLHAGVVLLLYLVLRKLLESVSGAATISFVTAVLFAVHPIHTDAVASIAARSELLAAGFLLTAWLLHMDDRPFSALLCLVLALMGKESAVVFLPLVIVGDYVRGKLKPLLRYVWIGAISGLYVALLWKVQGEQFGEVRIDFLDNPLAGLPNGLRVLNALRIAWKYLGLHVYPATLSYDYSYNAILLYSNWKHLAPAAFATIVVLGVWFWALWTGRREWFLAGALYGGGFAVTANILTTTGTLMAERLAYLPSAGFCLLVALTWAQVLKRKPMIAWAVLMVLVAGLSARTVARNRVWKDNLTLCLSGLRSAPGSARVHQSLGDVYMQLGQLDAAGTEFQSALGIDPTFGQAIEDYGVLESRLGHSQNALQLFAKALAVTPKGTLDYDFMEVNLALELMKLGQSQEALRLLNDEIEHWPGYAPAWANRAVIHFQRGELAISRTDAETALGLDPSNEQARRVLDLLRTPSVNRPVP